MCEVGTLKELNVKPGDVVAYVGDGAEYVVSDKFESLIHGDGKTYRYYRWGSNSCFRIISRASETPKLWRDMTPEEKGALLLAWHEGKVIEATRLDIPDDWRKINCIGLPLMAYRIRPEPKIETVTMGAKSSKYKVFGWEADSSSNPYHTHRITFNTIDGKPDCASIKMEAI